MLGSIILFGGGLFLCLIGIVVALIYSWEAKIKVNNNPNYKNDTDLKNARLYFNIASWICIVSSVVLVFLIAGFVIFSEVLVFFIKWILIITCVIYFIVLLVVEFYMFNGIISLKKSVNFTGEGDDATALRDARTGAWSILVAIVIIMLVGALVIFGKFKKKDKQEQEDEE